MDQETTKEKLAAVLIDASTVAEPRRAASHQCGRSILGPPSAVAMGVIGASVWSLFLAWLPRAQPREIELTAVEPADTEVTAYIASYLLPILAAASPTTGDIVAYVLCALLILIVAFAADLGTVNPVVYLFRLRVIRARFGEEHVIMLVREVPRVGTTVLVTQTLGVVLMLSDSEKG